MVCHKDTAQPSTTPTHSSLLNRMVCIADGFVKLVHFCFQSFNETESSEYKPNYTFKKVSLSLRDIVSRLHISRGQFIASVV